MSKRILIVEDEGLIAADIEMALESMGYKVVGKAWNGDLALDLIASTSPDLVILDITIQGTLTGIDLAKIIREKYNFPFVFLTSHADNATLNRVKETLPYGYIVKPFTDNNLKSTIELALFKYESETQEIFPVKMALENKLNIQLTQREYEIYSFLFKGMSYKEIAEVNFISVNTVKTFLKNLFMKLSVSSRHEASNLIIASSPYGRNK